MCKTNQNPIYSIELFTKLRKSTKIEFALNNADLYNKLIINSKKWNFNFGFRINHSIMSILIAVCELENLFQ